MDNQLEIREGLSGGDKYILETLSSQIYILVSNYDTLVKSDIICESTDDIFKGICKKARESVSYSNQKLSTEKLCYIAAIIVLKSGLFYVLEKAYRSGFDFEDL